jgi:hypothetical protein
VQHLKRPLPTLGNTALHPPGHNLILHYLAVGLVVVYHEHSQTTKIGEGFRSGLGALWLLFQGEGTEEGACLPGFALYSYLSSHELYQLLGDG